jgi:hypothetical protein
MTTTVKTFDEWAVVEIMGHKRFAGHVTEQAVGGASFVRVDVPEITLPTGDVLQPFTKLFGASSIYCISPCTEETAKAFAASIRAEGFARYEAPRLPAPSASTDERPERYYCPECGELMDEESTLCDDCEANHN